MAISILLNIVLLGALLYYFAESIVYKDSANYYRDQSDKYFKLFLKSITFKKPKSKKLK